MSIRLYARRHRAVELEIIVVVRRGARHHLLTRRHVLTRSPTLVNSLYTVSNTPMPDITH